MYVIYSLIAIFTLYGTTVETCQENDTCRIDLNDPNIQALLTGMEKFTDTLLRNVYTDDFVKGNVAFSPLSIYCSLALMLFGSTDKTLALLNQALGFPVNTDWEILKNDMKAILDVLEVTRTETVGSQKVLVENVLLGQAVFSQIGFKIKSTYEHFLDLIGAKYFYVDFTSPQDAVQTIKGWVAKQTTEEVNVGVDKPFPTTSRILLASSVFFSALWQDNLFPQNAHGVGEFYSLYKGKIVEIGTMSTSSAQRLLYLEAPGYYSCIQLPYEGGDNTMLIVLPHKDYAIWDFVKEFNMNEYSYIIKNSAYAQVNVTIPKFKGVWTSTFARYLIKMGMQDIFKYAELGNMIQDFQGGLEVAELLHAAAMELDESGTTVSTISTSDNIYGVSLMSIQSAEPPPTPINFVVGRPFLMYINNIQTGLPIYAALIRDL